MKTIISHFYNEEYLLPWWLKHHKKYFDHGIMINYASTDNSVDIIKEHCPNWEIIDSRNPEFSALNVDQEVIDIEANVSGWKIALNTTEFLVGNYNRLDEVSSNQEIYIPCFYFVDNIEYRESVDVDKPLYEQLFYGLGIFDTEFFRGSRVLHNHSIKYTLGRHYRNADNCSDFVIFNYGFSPMTDEIYKRKLQIQHRMPETDKFGGAGTDHTNFGMGLTKESLLMMYRNYLCNSKDLTEKMKYYVELMEK